MKDQIKVLDLKDRLDKFKKYLEAQVIPDPPDDLLTVYEMRVLHEHSFLRAEKYDSPEHQQELKEIQKENGDFRKIPRNIQNPNYDRLMDFYDQIIKSKSIPECIDLINQLHQFMDSFGLIKKFNWTPSFLESDLPQLDPRLFEQEPDLPLYLSYLLTKVRNRLIHEEFTMFLILTQNYFDDQSSYEALDTLRASRNSSKDYIDIVTQILEALNYHDSNYQINPNTNLHELWIQVNKYLKDESKDSWPLQSLFDLFNGIFCSMT